MEMLSDEFEVVAAYLPAASLAACMMVSKTVRALTEPHYEPGFIADYELQQSKWSRTAFLHDVRTLLPHYVHFSAEALRLLHLACEHYVYDVRAKNIRPLKLPAYMAVDVDDGTPDPDYCTRVTDSEEQSSSVYDTRSRSKNSRLPGYMVVDEDDATPDPDYHPG